MESIAYLISRLAAGAALALLLVLMPAGARGQEYAHDLETEHDPTRRHLAHADAHGGFPAYVDIFFTHHAYLERKFHPRFETTSADDLREHAVSGELVWQFGDRWGGEVEAAFVANDPEGGPGASGLSDVEAAPMMALLQDPVRLLIVTFRSGFVLPTGEEDEGLGIDGWGWEPGLLVWKGFGPEKRGAFQTELTYDRVFSDGGEDEQELVYNVGLSYWLPSNWIPIAELNGVTPLGGEEEGHGDTTLISGTLGFRYAFANGQQWGAGVQLPLNDRDAYDLRLVVGGIIHVE